MLGGTYVLEDLLDGDGPDQLLYRARHRDGELRAIRCLPGREVAAQSIVLEVRRLQALAHPAIPKVYDHFEHDGHAFLATEWVDGRRVSRLLEDGGEWAYERVSDLALQLAGVLDYLHRFDPPLVHGDLRPANLVVTPSHALCLVGFGYRATAYSAPEHRRESTAVTPQADVYAFGWTIAHLATGLPPDSRELGSQPERLAARLEALSSEGSRILREVLLRCLHANPKERYANGAALLAALMAGASEHDTSADRAHCKTCKEPVNREARHFCATCGSRLRPPAKCRKRGPVEVELTFSTPDPDQSASFAAASREQPLDQRRAALVRKLSRLDYSGSFDRLLCEPTLPFDPLPHQREAVLDVLRHKKGQALLADEVGLGKTIEALCVLAEYQQRGLVRRTLILTPPTLTRQWRDELVDKLGIPADSIHVLDSAASTSLTRRNLREKPVSIGVLRTRGRPPYTADVFKNIEFDLVIVDEVHALLSQARNKVKPRPLKTYQLVQGIHKKFVLLLSATPIQNTVVDLYELVNLTKPGKLLTWKEFESRYVESYEERRDGTKFPRIRRGKDLGQLLADVIVRHTRAQVMTTGAFPRRKAYTPTLRLSADERALYEAVRQRIAGHGLAERSPAWCLDVAGALCAHPRSFMRKVRNRHGWDDLIRLAEALPPPTKLAHLVEAVQKFVDEGHQKVLVFSAYDEARQEIARALGQSYRTYTFRRGDGNERRVQLLQQFAQDGTVLVVDDSAAVGLNLQFCDVLINYDLPSNPFLIEQRIGRVQRIGQQSDQVWIVNFLVKGTIDEIKLDVCQARLRMFEGVFGEAPTILGALEDEELSLESVYRDIYLETDAKRKKEQIKKLTAEMERARQRVATEESASRGFFDQCGWED